MADQLKSKLHFRRFEFKYILPSNKADLLLAYLINFMSFDPNVNNHDYYLVNSIYYDSPSFDHYQEKIDGINPRKKYRIRFYNNKPIKGETFFEIKRRFGNVIIKDRVKILPQLSKHFNYSYQTAKNSPVLVEFFSNQSLLDLKPKLIVRYKRTPLISKFNTGVRITLDYDLRADTFINQIKAEESLVHVQPNLTILEVKCHDSIPWWFTSLVKQYSLKRVSFSKYALATNQVYNFGDDII